MKKRMLSQEERRILRKASAKTNKYGSGGRLVEGRNAAKPITLPTLNRISRVPSPASADHEKPAPVNSSTAGAGASAGHA